MKHIIWILCLAVMACQEAPKEEPVVVKKTSEAELQQGQALYKRYGCAVCHGRSGHGNGQIARTLNPRPRDFHKVKEYKFGRSVAAITRTIEKGTINERGMGMPGYPQIVETERKLIAAFIVSLQEEQ
ncbi:MAG: cytochrome c [Candidatus Latescibacteria bacterium]|jgi:high-affinity iron transporter|nr:cytochrome c [Candidatus Latescibacterota bacterium]MBT5829873.1 cytochrome c [Candidatus Latescibacterota bacterium]